MNVELAAGTLDWLAEHAHENLGTELVMRAVVAGAEGWQAMTASGADGLAGVSVWAPGGQWYLEADSEAVVVELAGAVCGGWPAKVRTSGTVKVWLRRWLVEQGGGELIVREHDQLAMVCPTSPGPGEGRWAARVDRGELERYQAAYNEERGTTMAPDWEALVSRRAVAVLDGDGRVVAAVRRTADTARYATIANIWTDPEHRRRGFAARLMAFVLTDILTECRALHLIVDDDNTAAIALYRSLGFDDVGRSYTAYLSDAGNGARGRPRRGP